MDQGEETEEQIRSMLDDWSKDNVRQVKERVRKFRTTWGEGRKEPEKDE